MTENTKSQLDSLLQIAKSWGPWAVLVFYLLGAIPYVASPAQTSSKEHAIQNENMEKLLKATRGICYKLPDNPRRVVQCE